MLGFSYEKPIQEVIGMIKNGVLDKDIKEYIIELSERNELRRDIKEYFAIVFWDLFSKEEYGKIANPKRRRRIIWQLLLHKLKS